MTNTYPALRYLLQHAPERGLFPEERLELMLLLGRMEQLEAVNKDAAAVVDGLPELPRVKP